MCLPIDNPNIYNSHRSQSHKTCTVNNLNTIFKKGSPSMLMKKNVKLYSK